MNTTPETPNLQPCPCCGALTLTAIGDYEICDICGWEDDPVQSADPNFPIGANRMSLNQAREEWAARKKLQQG